MQENSENLLEVDQSDKKSEKSETVDLNDNVLQVDISDALSEREKVKFTIHTKVKWRRKFHCSIILLIIYSYRQPYLSLLKLTFRWRANMRSSSGCMTDLKRMKSTPVIL